MTHADRDAPESAPVRPSPGPDAPDTTTDTPNAQGGDEERVADALRIRDLEAKVTRYERHAQTVASPGCCVEYAEAAAMAVEQAGNAGFMEAAADSWKSMARREKARAEAAEAEAKGLAEHLGREIQRTSRVRALYRGDSENNRHAYCIRPADLLRALDGA